MTLTRESKSPRTTKSQNDTVIGPSVFRYNYLTPYDEAFHGWLGREAHVIDTSALTPGRAASEVVNSLSAA
ncbi:hypothetical protein [Arthrobacter psychrolactophilus]